MRFRSVAAGLLALLSSHALAFDSTKATRYPSPDLYRPNVDQLTAHGPLNCAPGANCDVSGLSVGGSPLGSGVISSVLTRLTPAQVADVRSGGATLDLAPVLNTVLNSCMPGLPAPTIRFTAGTYGVASPLLAQTCAVNIVLESGAVIKQTASFGSSRLRFGIIQIDPNAKGSSITGPGKIDGNREALVDQYLALPTGVTQVNGLFAIPTEWNCVLINAADDVTVSGPTLRGCMTFGIDHAAGQRARISNITVFDTADMIQSIYSDGTTWNNIRGYNLGGKVSDTKVVPWGSYVSGGNDLSNFTATNLSVDGMAALIYDGTSTNRGRRIGDPIGGLFMFQRIQNGTISGVTGRNVNYLNDVRATNAVIGIACDNCEDVAFSNVEITGCYWCFAPAGGKNVTLSNFTLDGQWNTTLAPGQEGPAGIFAQAGGQIRGFQGLDSSYDHVSNAPADNFRVANGVITRTGAGAAIYTSNVALNGVTLTGNSGPGVLLWAHQQFYAGGPVQPVRNIELANITATFNGSNGIHVNDGYNVRITNLTANNNGQDCATTFGCSGVQFTANYGGTKTQFWFSNWRTIDSQTESPITDKASFTPTSFDSSTKKLKFTMTNHARISVGQRIRLVNAASSGDITGKVMDKTEDIVTLLCDQAYTLNTDGNLVSQTGTLSGTANQNLITGSATSLSTVIKGPTVIKVAGQYLRVSQTNSAGNPQQAQVDNAPTANFSGATYQTVEVTVAEIKSQQVGMNVPADPTISNVSLGSSTSYQSFGNGQANIIAAPASIFNDWTAYTPTFASGDGTGVTFNGGATYKIDGKQLCMRGFVQANYSAAPSAIGVGLPAGLTTLGGGTVTGFSDSGALVIGIGNSAASLSLRAATGTLLTASGQYVQFNGCMQVQ